MVVADEAYCEFVEADDFPDGMSLIDEYPNLVIFRTFSKMYGLAGLRIGYLAANLALVQVIRSTCIVYSVNAVAQELRSRLWVMTLMSWTKTNGA